MSGDQLSAKKFAKWIPAREALDLALATLGPNRAAETILEHLRGGLLRSAAAKASSEIAGEDPELYSISEIPARFWAHLSTPDFLQTGNARFYWMNFVSQPDQTMRCFDIRFEPKGLRAAIPEAPRIDQVLIKPVKGAEPVEVPKGKPVSSAALAAWYAAYQLAFQGADDTMETALASAKGMFPGKFVSRDQVRKLAGGRKPGRKSKSAD